MYLFICISLFQQIFTGPNISASYYAKHYHMFWKCSYKGIHCDIGTDKWGTIRTANIRKMMLGLMFENYAGTDQLDKGL